MLLKYCTIRFAGGEVQRICVVLPGGEHAAEAPGTLGPVEGGAD